MELEKLIDLKRELLEMRKGNFIYISKSFFVFLLNCILLSGVCKFFVGSFPGVLEKEKKYKVEFFDVNNCDGLNKKIMYKNEKQLREDEFEYNTVTVKSKYMLDENGNYMRNVCIYRLDDSFEYDYKDVFIKYRDYVGIDSKIDEYVEYVDNIDDDFLDSVEVIVSYSVIDKNVYKYGVEDSKINDKANAFCMPFGCFLFIKLCYDVGSEFVLISCDDDRKKIKREIKELKKKKSS